MNPPATSVGPSPAVFGAPKSPECRNFRPPGGERMEYRRFGKTNKALSAITLGGMRYTGGWGSPRNEPHREMIEHAMASIRRALDEGINHVETAYGYGKSEYCHGVAMSELGVPRESYFLMTKGAPLDADATHRMLEEQLRGLRTDHVDFYGWHGLNNRDLFAAATKKGGPVETLLRYREQGVIGHVGFSTHAPLDVITDAVQTGLFEFVNLHYYYFFQRNFGGIALAEARDLGVFVISPNDKGGQLFHPPELLSELVRPLTPIQWNARFCLRLPAVHTLSFGMTAPEHFDEMRGIFPTSMPLSSEDLAAQLRLDARLAVDPLCAYEGYELVGDASGLNIPEILRFRRMWKCYDMEGFGKYRYNMFEEKDHWFPGALATPERVAEVDLSRVPPGIPLREMLNETHAALFVDKSKK